jgi:hypothetical protein
MSTYLAAWAILPETYGKKVDDDDEATVCFEILISILFRFILDYCMGSSRTDREKSYCISTGNSSEICDILYRVF